MIPFQNISLKAKPASAQSLDKMSISSDSNEVEKMDKAKLPSVSRMVVNAARAAVDVGVHAVKHVQVFADSETAHKRIHGCSNRNGEGLACKLFQKDSVRCGHPKCGCFLKAKVILQAMKCPDGVW